MDWRDKAACLTADPELFFPVGNTGPAVDQIEKAKTVCGRAPSRRSASSTPSRPVRTRACGVASAKTSAAPSSAAPLAPAALPSGSAAGSTSHRPTGIRRPMLDPATIRSSRG